MSSRQAVLFASLTSVALLAQAAPQPDWAKLEAETMQHYQAIRPRPLSAEAFTDEATYRETRLPVELAVTLIPDAYTSAEFFGLERVMMGTDFPWTYPADHMANVDGLALSPAELEQLLSGNAQRVLGVPA